MTIKVNEVKEYLDLKRKLPISKGEEYKNMRLRVDNLKKEVIEYFKSDIRFI